MPLLRPLRDPDVEGVLELNQRNIEALTPMDEPLLRQLARTADRFDVLEVDGQVAGFVVTLGPGTAYDSENYRWFDRRHHGHGFYYLDRIVLDESFRRRRLGSFVYDEVEATASGHGRLALEVNLVPRNHASLAFHAQRGFVEVGRLGDQSHLVSLMEKPLTSPTDRFPGEPV
jgi:uncharacterized protein